MNNHMILRALSSLVLILSCAAMVTQPGMGSAEISTLPTCYVNASTGDDANHSGASPDEAKRTIQACVDAVDSGGAVEVAAGHYVEQVTISKPLTLEGAGVDATYVDAPLAVDRERVLNTFTIDGIPTEIPFDYMIGVMDSTDVTIRNLTVDGLSHGVIDCIPKLHASGVLFLDSSGTFEDAKVVNMREDSGQTSCKDEVWFGYQAAAASANGRRSVTVQNVELSNFQYIGVYAWTDAQNNLTADIQNNHIEGRTPFTRATQRGIQISGGATGVIAGNTLENFSSTGLDPWPSTAILAVGASGLRISNNTINNSQLGIYLYFTDAAIEGNKISVSQSGSGLTTYRAVAIFKPPLAKADTKSAGSSAAQQLQSMSVPQALIVEPVEPFEISISNNELIGGGDSSATIGVDIDQGYSARDIELTANNNKIHGWGSALYFGQCIAGPGETCRTGKFATLSIGQNSFSGDITGIDNTVATTASAEGNWWGDVTGPQVTGNPHGKGAAIVGPATFDPWLCDGTDAEPDTVGFQPSDAPQCTVVGNNHPPVLASIGDIVINDGETRTIGVTATDSDDDALTFTAANLPSFASLTDHGDGTASLALTPGDGDVGVYPNVTITVNDHYTPSPASDQETFTITVIDNDADLSVTLTDGLTEIFPSTPITYTLVVHNAGTAKVSGAILSAAIDAHVTSVTWTCTASADSSCTASGSGNSLTDTVNLAVDGTLTYTITGVADAAYIGDLESTAQISVPDAMADPNPLNNHASDVTKVVYRKFFLPLIRR